MIRRYLEWTRSWKLQNVVDVLNSLLLLVFKNPLPCSFLMSSLSDSRPDQIFCFDQWTSVDVTQAKAQMSLCFRASLIVLLPLP